MSEPTGLGSRFGGLRGRRDEDAEAELPATPPPGAASTAAPAAAQTPPPAAAAPAAAPDDGEPKDPYEKHRPLIDELIRKAQDDLQARLDAFGSAPVNPQELLIYEQKLRDAVSDFVRAELQRRRDGVAGQAPMYLPAELQQQITRLVVAEVRGFGPMQELLDDDGVSEVMVCGPKRIFFEKSGKLVRSPLVFKDDEHVLRIIDRILIPLGRRVDTNQPLEDARLPDGSRVNVIIPPLAIDGPAITIRKFGKKTVSPEQMLEYGSFTKDMLDFLRACVKGRLNIVVSGGTGSGKTTLLNMCATFIPEDERIVVIEDAAELRVHQTHKHVVRLEARKANIEGKGAVPIRELVKNSLRMRPDRVVIGECRSGEMLDALTAMNTGHDGSLTTLHSNSPRDAIKRMETMCLMSGVELPQRAIREQITSAVNIIVQISRLKDGSRKVTNITEITGMEGETPTLQNIFEYKQEGYDEKGKARGQFTKMVGLPRCAEQLAEHGIDVKSTFVDLGRLLQK